MIIFDLDGTLADCEHRRHFVDPKKNTEFPPVHIVNRDLTTSIVGYENPITGKKFKPNWKAFYEACDKDLPIEHVIEIFSNLTKKHGRNNIKIWSGRCESVHIKTLEWLTYHIPEFHEEGILVRMRPIGDNTPDDILKERWLDEYTSSMWPKLSPVIKENEGEVLIRKDPIDFVFESDPESIKMWKRRGFFVFDVNQKEF